MPLVPCTSIINKKLMNLPESFVSQMQHILGAEYPNFVESLQKEAPTTIRLNSKKMAADGKATFNIAPGDVITVGESWF